MFILNNIKWALALVGTEAITELLLHSALLNKPRTWLCRFNFFKELFSCGWCLSLWAGLLVFGLLLLRLEIILVPIVFHRVSNYLHAVYSFVKYARRP